MERPEQRLLGIWESEPSRLLGGDVHERISMVFKPDSKLIYTVHLNEKDQIIILEYDVRDGKILTNQPSHPQEETTAFSFTDDGKLILTYQDNQSIFTKLAEA